MDARNDDSSGGSDSLDKSLQLKCVVDDIGQGEGKQAENIVNEAASTTSLSNNEHKIDTNHRSHLNKTEKTIGDADERGGSDSDAIATTSATATVDVSNKRECNEISTNTTTTATINNHINSSCSNSSNNNNHNNNNNAFETKVKQISKDLKETTLAEYNTISEDSAQLVCSSSTSSISSETVASNAGASVDPLENCDQLNVSDSADDTRSKKVRFHPDVKENDGGNRVIPKKKKKLKGNSNEEAGNASDTAQCTTATDDDMDYEEEEEEEAAEEEEEFNLEKTIAEAQNYLKMHPLTFVRSNNIKSGTNNTEDTGKRLHNGLLQEEDLPLLSESSEEEDFYEEITPECGVERILGKQVRNGKTLLLVRYLNDGGLYWENEERIATMCPTMMSKYEINRERRQERLMRHVAKRQNLRQRYTDF